MLAAGQEDLARLFASKAPEDEKFAGVQHTVHDGIPVIEGALAWVGCTLQELIPGGDHTIGIGAVTAAEAAREAEPLLWYRGEYRVSGLHIAARRADDRRSTRSRRVIGGVRLVARHATRRPSGGCCAPGRC